MTDVLEEKKVAETKKVNNSNDSMLEQPMQTGNQQEQPDVATFTKQTIADLPDNMPPAKMQIRDLDFYYGDFRALKEINIDIPEKNVTAFIGPSGCGKSTLLRTFNRMYDLYPNMHAEGKILLDGKNVLDKKVDVNLLRARVGMVFQKPTPFPMSMD